MTTPEDNRPEDAGPEYGESVERPSEAEAAETPTPSAEEEVKTNFETIRPILSELTDEDKKRQFKDALFFFMEKPEKVIDVLENMKSSKLDGTQEELTKYRHAIEQALSHHPVQGMDVSPFGREESYWRQAVDHNGDEISAGRPRFSNSGKLSGDAALFKVRAAAGLGTIVNVPLWHTGIWLKLKAPSEGTLLELERRIALEKIDLGRSTVGVAFTNASIYVNTYLIDMILNHVYDGTYKDLSPKALKRIIKVTDIPQLVWGMACAIWPNGYKLVQPCVSDPSQCRHLNEAHVNVSKLSWVDNRALSTAQRNLMANRDGNVDDEKLTTYSNEHTAPQTRRIQITDEMSIGLRVPSIADYEVAGFRWVDGIVRMVDEAFGQSIRGEERNDYISQQGAMSNLRRYSHWIHSIDFTDDTSADDRESIDSALDGLTASDEIRKKIVDGVESFIRSSVINAIGIPRYDCPSCGGEPGEYDVPQRLQEIIQLEVNEIFFTLQYMRVTKVLAS